MFPLSRRVSAPEEWENVLYVSSSVRPTSKSWLCLACVSLDKLLNLSIPQETAEMPLISMYKILQASPQYNTSTQGDACDGNMA